MTWGQRERSNGVALTTLGQVKTVSRRLVAAIALVSAAAALLGILFSWPLWAMVSLALAPWFPLYTLETDWARRHYGWLSLFYVLVITQTGHMIEHIAQMFQLHVLNETPPGGRGIFGALDIEWVHFGWNTWVLIATVFLAARFARNPWLWATLAVAVWHEGEHAYILARYLMTGTPGDAGLAAMNGVLFGGLPLARPDLHFLYNALEIALLFAAFVYQLRRSHDAWLARAFPTFSADALALTTAKARVRRFSKGEQVVAGGGRSDTLYVVARGRVAVFRGRRSPAPYKVLGPGQVLGKVGHKGNIPRTGIGRARTSLDLLEVDTEVLKELSRREPDASRVFDRLLRSGGSRPRPGSRTYV